MAAPLSNDLDVRGPSSGTEATSTPFSESCVTTPATTADTPSDDCQTKGPSIAMEGDNDHDGADTPRKPDTNSRLLENQVQKLQAKLAEIEKETELEKLERAKIEQRLDETITLAIANGVLDNERVRRFFHRRFPHFDDGDEDGPPVSMHICRTIRGFEREINRLNREKERIDELWDDRDRLRSMQQEWEEERAELLLKQAELERLGAVVTRSGANTPAEPTTEDSPPLLPVYEKPELNRVEWTIFKSILLRETKGSFAIDVLKGDPVVSFERPTNAWYLRPRGVHRRPVRSSEEKAKPRKPASTKQPPGPGQSPLPERIRINSKHLLKVFETIHGESMPSDSSVIMIRPYKALAYYEEPIRQKFQELQQKFEALDPRPWGPNVADTPNQTQGGDVAKPSVIESKGETTTSAQQDQDETSAAKDDDDQDEFTSSLTTYQHLRCLTDFMDGDIKEKLEYLASDRCQTVSFPDIWYLFKPGDEVIEQSRRQAYRIISITSSGHQVFPPWRARWDKEAKASEETPVILNCVYVDFDGKQLGPMTRKVKIARFDGDKTVTSLEVFPLRFAEGRKFFGKQKGAIESKTPSLREKLITRGRMFLDMTSFKHMHYTGPTLDTRDEVDSHVVVDFEEAFSANPKLDWRPEFENLIEAPTEKQTDEESCTADCCKDEIIHKDAYVDKKRNQEYMALLIPDDRQREPSPVIYPRLLQDIKGEENALSDDDLVIMSYRVFGFVLRNRKWAQLDLNCLSLPETASNENPEKVGSPDGKGDQEGDGASLKKEEKPETAFDQLVLPEGHKDMVLSLIAQHFRDKESASKESRETQQVDIVRGKGKGLIILLHGSPGVGKTTTAEGVAEMFKKPLFQITCVAVLTPPFYIIGDLGTTASEVEEALETHFTLANRWGCVLLLDEADVFLAARSKEDFIRNGLVSGLSSGSLLEGSKLTIVVFLRVLEYYAGILFLTTNRVGDFDEAFASRIHISLYYPQLDLRSTKAIFELNLSLIDKRFKSKQRKIEIEEDKILKFAVNYFNTHSEEKWNGRQIRNACQTALALAEFRAQGGSHERVEHADAVVKLKVEDLEVVSNAYLQFMRYLNEVRGQDVERWAKLMKVRAREVDVLLKDGEMDRDKRKTAVDKKKDGHHENVPTTVPHPHQSAQLGVPQAVDPAPQWVSPAPQPHWQPTSTAAPPAPPAQQYGPPPGPHQAYYYGHGGYPPSSLPVGPGYVPPPAGPQGAWHQQVAQQQQATQQQATQLAPPVSQGTDNDGRPSQYV
ncbi:hypothetical protein FDECE_11147 [Fusarium decemcellulare]|nr:hypothetical protein FDECE_11147 [Fusarium decemcellulare]